MSLRVGDIVRTKDKVGILDGVERGPGHHEYYKVIQLNPKGDVVLQSGTGAQSVWEPQQVEVTTYGCYLAELIAEAKHHLGWVSADCNKILQQYAPDNLVNLEALEFLRNKIAEKIQSALDVAYEDVAAGLFAERADDGLKLLEPLLDFTPNSVTQQIEDLKDRVKEAFLLTPAEMQFSADGRFMMASTKPEQPMVMSTPPEITDAELLSLSYPNSVPASDPWADLMGYGLTLRKGEVIGCYKTKEEADAAFNALKEAKGIPNIQRQHHMQALAPNAVALGVGPGWEMAPRTEPTLQQELHKEATQFKPSDEISLTKLGELTGKKTDHLNKLIERGVLPPGRKVGRVRWMPAQECYNILMTDKEPYKHWQKQEPAALANTWDSLL